MKHLFVPYELAKLAKEKGFDEACLYWYWHKNKELLPCVNEHNHHSPRTNTEIAAHSLAECVGAPLYQQLVDWFREKHQIIIEVQLDQTSDVKFCIEVYHFIRVSEFERVDIPQEVWGFYRNHREALTAALTKAFETI